MKMTLKKHSIIFKTKIFESRTKNKDTIYTKYRCSVPNTIIKYAANYTDAEISADGSIAAIYIMVDPQKKQYQIFFNNNTAADIDDDADVLKRKLYQSGKENNKSYSFIIPNKLMVYAAEFAVFTVTNDRKIFLHLE